MLHAAFLRSPHAHARIAAIDTSAARAAPGVAAVMTGRELARHHSAWVGTLAHHPATRSAPQHALAVDRACWHGEPVAVVAAESRAAAEDAVDLIRVEWEPLPAIADPEAALAPGAPLIHPELGSNVAYERQVAAGDVAAAFATAHAVVEENFRFGRHTAVSLEPRGLVAAFAPAEPRLTLYHSGQSPHQLQALFARVLNLPEQQIRVVNRDVGGGFGLKLNVFGDEVATAVLAILLRRPVKFIADRLEAFASDIHAREHVTRARMGVDANGTITALEIDDIAAIGPYAAYPRSSVSESNMVLNLTGTQYRIANYHARARVVLQNKSLIAQLRGVGLPVAMAICERMVDKAAAALGQDPAEIRRRNLVPDDAYPCVSVTGARFDELSHHACLDKLLALMDYAALRREQAALRARGIHRGIGLATYVEGTGPGPATYGPGAPISAQDGATLRLDPSGAVVCASGLAELGQGADTMLAQVVAGAVGVAPEMVRVITGDTDATPYGGGAWGSRGTATGGAAAWRSGRALRDNILAVAGVLLQSPPDALDIRGGAVVSAGSGEARLSLADLAATIYYRGYELPKDLQPELMVTRHYRLTDNGYFFVNGIQASYLELDPDTGMVRLLKHWAVEDCGRIVNPLLVDEQLRGGIVQGLGAALLEHCAYDAAGQLCNGTLADYHVPMAAEMPDIVCGHVETPSLLSPLGAKGVGESGIIAAPAAVLNAVNDALLPFGASVAETPITPRVLLRALGRIED